jgi:hypothetical protein
MRAKARFVLGAMEQRVSALGFGWADVAATQAYTIFDIHPLLADEFVRRLRPRRSRRDWPRTSADPGQPHAASTMYSGALAIYVS